MGKGKKILSGKKKEKDGFFRGGEEPLFPTQGGGGGLKGTFLATCVSNGEEEKGGSSILLRGAIFATLEERVFILPFWKQKKKEKGRERRSLPRRKGRSLNNKQGLGGEKRGLLIFFSGRKKGRWAGFKKFLSIPTRRAKGKRPSLNREKGGVLPPLAKKKKGNRNDILGRAGKEKG